ncbi:MAG: tRNA-specific 2-thiouridylase [Desulfovibrionaceae bacterium]|nr:tRNA-specific 2-thiouridylase [Desulfovibrionaceae bacterium]
MNIAVAVSGGTDSLYALLSLREAGHEVVALHARFLPASAADPVPALASLCARLGVPLRVLECAGDFERLVIAPFADEHRRARTPNPCALCNRAMKFGRLLDETLAPSDASPAADALATGHYAAMAEHPVYGRALRCGNDPAKDQSYFLALTPLERLRRCVFPLADMHKSNVRAWLAARGETPPLPHESQEICFVPGDDHYAFLSGRCAARGESLPGPGPVVLDDPGHPRHETAIAEHQGLWRYTEGQRKGLGIAWSEPLFVLRRERERNALIVGGRHKAAVTECAADGLNLMVDTALWPSRLYARTRYRQVPAPAEAWVEGQRLRIRFASPQPPPAPGQVAALYDEYGFVLAGGTLCGA